MSSYGVAVSRQYVKDLVVSICLSLTTPGFYGMTRIPGFIALASIVFCVFILFAFIVLPAEVTKRHYLNTCLLMSIILLEVRCFST